MSNASLELGGGKWAAKEGNLLGYASSTSSSKYVPREFSFTRAADIAATRVNSSGLIEKYRENLLLQSNQFDTTWTTFNASVTSGQSGYDGSNNAWLLNATGATGVVRQTISLSGVQTFSIYAKQGVADAIEINSFSNVSLKVNLTNGSVITSGSANIDSSVTSISNGYYRITITANGSATIWRVYISKTSGSVTSGDNIYIQDAQLERGLAATSYLESGATTAKAGVLDNLPRIDYTGGTASLLLEPQRTNLIPQSEYFDSWTAVTSGTGLTPIVTNNYTISPEGVKNATRVQLDIGTGTSDGDFAQIQTNISTTTATTYTGSVYFKSNTGVNQDIVFQINGQAIVATTITPQWTRYDVSAAAISTGGFFRIRIRGNEGTNKSADFSVYGAQLEEGSYPTSYIPTYGTSDTRVADFFDSSADFTNFFGNNQGTIYIETDRKLGKGESSNQTFIGFRESSTGNYWRILARDSQTFVQSIGWGTTITYIYGITNPTKYLFKWDGTTISFYIDGSLVGSVSQTATFNPNEFGRVGSGVSMKSQEFLKQFTLFSTALTDAECAILTT